MNTVSFFNPKFTSDFFDAFDRNFYGRRENPEMPKRFVPKVDIREVKDSYVLDMELAGYSEDEVEIEINDKVLSVFSKCCDKSENVEKAEESNSEEEISTKVEEFKWLLKERGFGTNKFYRSFKLPEDINIENVKANFKNGLLSIFVPKKTETKTRKITISA